MTDSFANTKRTVKDLMHGEVGVGDRIAVAFRQGNSAELRVGRVVGFGERADPYGWKAGSNDTLVVEWEGGSGYGYPTKKSQIQISLRRFVKIA